MFPEQAFFQETTRKRVTEAIAQIESRTSAEIMVTVRQLSGSYRHVDYAAGFVLSVIALGAMLYADYIFPLLSFLPGVLMAFAAGALFSSQFTFIKRHLIRSSLKRSRCEQAARAAFYDMGVSRSKARGGILVYISMFEREVVVL